jgi:hypothetical protein
MIGQIGILNIGCGDTKLTFDPNNPQECIRAARIVKDMLRRGYALLIEVTQHDGTKKFQRAYDFDENTYEYIIADFDPEIAAQADTQITGPEKTEIDVVMPIDAGGTTTYVPTKRGRKTKTKTVSAFGKNKAVAVAHTAGG